MDLIEQAAKRLEQLRQAGIEIAADALSSADHGVHSAVAEPSKPVGGRPDADGRRSRTVQLDMAFLESKGIITPHSERSLFADELRVIKRPLLDNVAGRGAGKVADANLIMVTSAVPSEGKTHLATNLAMSIAMELDHTVLLVDADVARPSIPTALGIEVGKGLLDLLVEDSIDPSDVLLRTNVEKLSLLPAGTSHPRATELLASDAMIRLVDEMCRRYSDRVIIFDSPPLLLTTEARALATHMGQVVLVVKAESTSHMEVKQAVGALELCPIKMVVLNQATGGFGGHGYGYGYGYGYGESRRTSTESGPVE